MLLAIDPASDTPRHRQVYDALRQAILTGRLRPGDRLPATRSLAGDLSLSRTTVAEAYDQLQSEGYIQGKHGSGTYVAFDLPEAAFHSAHHQAGNALISPSVPLSRWGRQVTESAPPSEPAAEFLYDFRPHRGAADLFPWAGWRASVDRALAGDRNILLRTPPIAGHPELRSAIAEHVARYRAVRCTAEQVVVLNGTQGALNLLAQLLLDPGDRVAVEDPGYPAARLALAARGLSVTRVPVDAEGLVVEELVRAGAHRLVHVTPSHQDPTGATLSLSRRVALLEEAGRRGCLIFEDDYDSEFRYEGRPVESLQGLDHRGLVVYAGTFSKSLLAGLRLGFLVLPPPLVEPFVAAKAIWDGGTPMLEQAALAQFLLSGDFERHIRRMRRLYRRRRDALVEALPRHFGERAEVGARHGGLNVLVTLDVPLSDAEITERAASLGIALRPASAYYTHAPAKPTFLMGFAAQDEQTIERGIARLASISMIGPGSLIPHQAEADTSGS